MSKIMYGGIAYGSAVDKDYGWTDLTGTLRAGETTLTIQHEIITPDVTVVPHSNPFGINPTDMVVTNGQVVLTFNARPNDVGVMVRVSKTNPVLKFTKTSIIDPTQSPNIAFNSDYTNYDLLLFVFNDPLDNKQIEFLLTADMITEIVAVQGVYPLMFARLTWEGGQFNRHARFAKSSNTLFQRITGQLDIVNVYAVTCNKNIVKTDIYKRGDSSSTTVSVESDNIFDNDIILMSFSENGFTTVNNQYVNLMNITELSQVIGYSCALYNNNIKQILIDNSSMSSWYYFYVQGIKFT